MSTNDRDAPPARTNGLAGPGLIGLGIVIRLGLSAWGHHDPYSVSQTWWWVYQLLNDVGLAAIVLGCVMVGLGTARRG